MDLCGHTERKAKQEGYLGYLLDSAKGLYIPYSATHSSTMHATIQQKGKEAADCIRLQHSKGFICSPERWTLTRHSQIHAEE